jgi:hypothetical protein
VEDEDPVSRAGEGGEGEVGVWAGIKGAKEKPQLASTLDLDV